MSTARKFTGAEAPLRTVARGDVPASDLAHVAETLERVARSAPRTVREITATLIHERDPARKRPFVAKASIDVDGRLVRGHVAAATMPEAIEALEEHVSRRLRDLADRQVTERAEPGVPTPGEWRHGDLPTPRPEYFPRPTGERRVVRRKTYAGGPETVEEAVWEMRALDHDFFLFTNSASNEENVVYDGPDGVLHLRQPAPAGEAWVEPVIVDAEPAPICTEQEAIEMFDLVKGRFLFFVDSASGRGALLYRRYDGHYGIVHRAVA